ncbi:MAG: hypothetical protein U0229_05625 [Anaeromyxobacter sp.]
MIAYKFLERGAVGPFSRFAWPLPSPGAPGPWVEAREARGRRHGVYACLPGQLAWWIDEELFRVELGGEISVTPVQVVAGRARLLEPVDAWTSGGAARFAADCARRLAAAAAATARAAGLPGAADALERADGLPALSAAARAASGAAPDPVRIVLALAADGAALASAGHASGAAYIAARAARLIAGDAGFRAEREAQGRRLAAEVGAAA